MQQHKRDTRNPQSNPLIEWPVMIWLPRSSIRHPYLCCIRCHGVVHYRLLLYKDITFANHKEIISVLLCMVLERKSLATHAISFTVNKGTWIFEFKIARLNGYLSIHWCVCGRSKTYVATSVGACIQSIMYKFQIGGSD